MRRSAASVKRGQVVRLVRRRTNICTKMLLMTEARDEKLEKINRPAAEYWSVMVRFLVLANAGGAVTVISFLGASSYTSNGSWFALGPLVSFFLGIVFAGIATIGGAGQALFNALLATSRIVGKEPEIPKITKLVLVLRRAAAWPEMLAFVFFILGGVSGLVFLGILLTASDGTTSAPGAAVI